MPTGILVGTCVTLVLLTGCAVSPRPVVSIEVPDPNRARFSGKGAGAGVMMSASMGPMGIAIGVAIDEGIGKDIDLALQKSGFDLSELLTRTAQQSNKALSKIRVNRYGFVLQPGREGNDPVAAMWDLVIKTTSGEQKELRYPSDSTPIPVEPLDTLKKNGKAAQNLLEQSLEALLNSA